MKFLLFTIVVFSFTLIGCDTNSFNADEPIAAESSQTNESSSEYVSSEHSANSMDSESSGESELLSNASISSSETDEPSSTSSSSGASSSSSDLSSLESAPAESSSEYVESSSSVDMSIGINAFQHIEAEASENIVGFEVSENGTFIRNFNDGNYLKFTDVNFGSGVNRVTFKVAQENMQGVDFSGAFVELHIGSKTGEVIGTFYPEFTANWNTFEEQAVDISVTSGLHDLYIVANHDLGAGDYDYLYFEFFEKYTGTNKLYDPNLSYSTGYTPTGDEIVISRSQYMDRLQGFWLGECIANWTGLITEMDKYDPYGDFYTRDNWGGPDDSNPWGTNIASRIDFNFLSPWGSDDDTDIEYIYHHILYENKTSILTGQQIKDGWVTHIRNYGENYLWESNQKAFDLMNDGFVPPETGNPDNNDYYVLIDAQLTTEIFGFYSPARPDVALKMAHLPIQTTARFETEWMAEFYVIMYSLASYVDTTLTVQEQTVWLAEQASQRLPAGSYPALMYAFVKEKYAEGVPWEEARDAVNKRYQIDQLDGYLLSTSGHNYSGGFVGGINFAASLISLLYGEGDIKETIKIGVLCGWDSDNPTATWGGLLGFMIGKKGVTAAFSDKSISDEFNIHRTRQNFPNDGLITFPEMAEKGIFIIDRVVQEEMGGAVDLEKDVWYIPNLGTVIAEGN